MYFNLYRTNVNYSSSKHILRIKLQIIYLSYVLIMPYYVLNMLTLIIIYDTNKFVKLLLVVVILFVVCQIALQYALSTLTLYCAWPT